MKATILILCMITFCFCEVASAEIPEKLAIRALIGEASGEGYRGLLAIAGALRNRGTLRGVYGVNAAHVDREPQWVWDMARKAWKESLSHDITGSATHWENVQAFGEPYWASSMIKTIKIGNHQFYKER